MEGFLAESSVLLEFADWIRGDHPAIDEWLRTGLTERRLIGERWDECLRQGYSILDFIPLLRQHVAIWITSNEFVTLRWHGILRDQYHWCERIGSFKFQYNDEQNSPILSVCSRDVSDVETADLTSRRIFQLLAQRRVPGLSVWWYLKREQGGVNYPSIAPAALGLLKVHKHVDFSALDCIFSLPRRKTLRIGSDVSGSWPSEQ